MELDGKDKTRPRLRDHKQESCEGGGKHGRGRELGSVNYAGLYERRRQTGTLHGRTNGVFKPML